jgi:hypothetical protein
MILMTKWTKIGEGCSGIWGTPGTPYDRVYVWIWSRSSRCRVMIRNTYGSHQGYLQEHGRSEVICHGDRHDWRSVALAARREAIDDIEMDRCAVTEAICRALAEIEEAAT